MPYAAVSYTPTPANANPNLIEHLGGIDAILADVRRVVRLTGGTTNLTLANHSNALVILESGVNTINSGGAGTFVSTIWNRSGNAATVGGINLPNNEVAIMIIDGANSIVEVSQTFNGVLSVSVTSPITNVGSATAPNININDMVGATGGAAGSAGAVPAPGAGQQDSQLHGDGTWRAAATGFPVADNVGIFQGSADATKQMVFELDGNTPGTTRTVTAADVDINLGHVPDIRRVVRVTGGALALTQADHSNALIIITGAVAQTFTSGGADTFPVTVWNQGTATATLLGQNLPAGEVGLAIIDGGNNVAEISQTFSGVTAVTATGPVQSSGGTAPDISILTNVANGVALFDGTGAYPAADGSAITNVSANAMTGATAGAAGTSGSVPIPAAGDQGKVLLGSATWADVPPFQDTSVIVQDSLDNTKQIMFEAGNITGGQTRIITMDDADVDLALVKEINREVQITANITLTIADHRNAFLPVTTAGVTVTPPGAGAFYATGANFSAADITVGGVTVGTMQMFTILCFGGTSIVKAST